jgi:hypothetical protein
MSRSQDEQLESLDNFQRAEFLRMQRTQVTCARNVFALREKTAALGQKQLADHRTFKKLEFSFFVVVGTIVFLQLIFNFLSSADQFAFFVMSLIVSASYIVLKTVHENCDQILFETYTLELTRYESEIEMNGLSVYYGQEDDLTQDILNALGFHDGRIGGALNAEPLKAAE